MTEPVGLKPPVTVAVSETAPPRKTGGEAWVVILGAAWVTTTDSLGSLQAVDATVAPPSWYSATQR